MTAPVMRPFLLLLVAVLAPSAPAGAQERPPLTPDQEAALYGLPVAVTVGGALLLLNVAEEHDAQLLVLAMPLIAGATACGAGRLTGAAGSCRGALLGGALGALPSLALVGLGAALQPNLFGNDWNDALGAGLLIMGAVAYVLVPPFTAVHGYRRGARVAVSPAVLGAQKVRGLSPGLSLRVGL